MRPKKISIMIWTILLILPYSVIILIAWIKVRKAGAILSGEKVSDDSLPDVSVIVAARNEEVRLPLLISDLQSLDYPTGKLEVFIVDDHSSDATARIIKEAGNIIYLLANGEGKKHAIASGMDRAKGELVLTTDADCRLPSGWVKAYAESYRKENADLIIGQVKPVHRSGLISIFSELEFYSLQAVTGGLATAKKPVMCNGANLGFRKSSIKDYLKSVKSGLASGDDMFLLHSTKKSGGKIVWLNNTRGTVSNMLPARLKEFLRQRSRWAGKSIYYRDIDTIVLSISTLVANLTIFAAIILVLINPTHWPFAIILYAAKTIPEILLLSGYLPRPEKLRLLLLYLPASLLYPVHVLLTVIISMFSTKKW